MPAIWPLLKQTYSEYSEDKVPSLAAALAYYTAFSLAPLLVIIVAVAGFVYGDEAARGQVVSQMQSLIGRQPAEAAQSLIQRASQHGGGVVATIISVVVLFFGAGYVFAELQDSLNTIWGVQPRPDRSWGAVIRSRFLSFAMVLAMAFLLLVSLVISTVVSALANQLSNYIPGGSYIGWAADLLVSLTVVTLLFATIFKVLPDVKIEWRHVWLGALITAVLFAIGKLLLGLYLGRSTAASVYGAAGSLAALLIWVYYSAQILFIGAEFTQVYAARHGDAFEPTRDAVPVASERLADMGIPRRADIEAAAAATDPSFATACPVNYVRAKAPRGRRWLPLVLGFAAGQILRRSKPPKPPKVIVKRPQ